MSNNLRKLEKVFLKISDNYRHVILVSLIILIPSVYLLVYRTGGGKYVYTHLMYIPIVLAGLALGNPVGAFTGLVCGIFLGPLMPLDTHTGEPQMALNWIIRLIVFIFIGFLSGFFTTVIRNFFKQFSQYLSTNPETNIENTNYITNNPLPSKPNQTYLIVTILIYNHEKIVGLVGTDVYNQFLRTFHAAVKNQLKDSVCYFVQAESNKLWLVMELNDFDQDMDNLLGVLAQPLNSATYPFYVDYSLGCTTVQGSDKLKHFSVYSQADEAALLAKISGARYEVYNLEKMQKETDFNLLGEFQKALKEHQTHLVYQPEIDLKTNKPFCFEALIRWEHPDYGLIMPNRFIPLIEQTNLIHDLTDWVFTQVIEKILEFRDHDIDIIMSVNISSKNLANPNFFKSVISKLREAAIDPSQIILEITESHFMVNPKENINVLNNFVKTGMRIAIDDFGTGYSSLSLLGQLPVKIIKIDRSFIRDIDLDATTYHIVSAIIDIAHKLGCKVVAEGIETKNIHDIAKILKADYTQGFYYSKPIHRDKVIEWYKNQVGEK